MDETVPGAWDHPPAGSLDYAPDVLPQSQSPKSSAASIEFELDSEWQVGWPHMGKVGR